MKPLSAPLDVQIEVTEECNLCCVHCYNYWRTTHECHVKRATLNSEQLTKILGRIAQEGVFGVTLTGGEPMLYPAMTVDAITFAKSLGLEVGLNTNATLISQSQAINLRKSGLDHALVSLLGTREVHDRICGHSGMWERTCNGIRYLVAAGIPVAVSFVVSKLNINDVRAVGELAKELGVTTFCATPVTPAHPSHLELTLSVGECKGMLRTLILVGENEAINIDTLEPLPRCMFEPEEDGCFERFFGNRLCGAGVSTCVVSAKGEIRPCIHADVNYSNLLEDDFQVAWGRMSGWRCDTMLPADCRQCAAIGICEGGCRMSGKLANGGYDAPDLYMSAPIKDVERLRRTHTTPTSVNLNASQTICFNTDLRIRHETFGGVTYHRGQFDFFNDHGLALLDYLKSRGRVTVDEFCRDRLCTIEQASVVVARLTRSHAVAIQ
jgi:radical SAM protein with 4Fe4S-binding SPASM domain